PHITVKNALYQLDQVAAARAAQANRDPAQVRKQIEEILHKHSQAPLGAWSASAPGSREPDRAALKDGSRNAHESGNLQSLFAQLACPPANAGERSFVAMSGIPMACASLRPNGTMLALHGPPTVAKRSTWSCARCLCDGNPRSPQREKEMATRLD